MLYTFVKGIDKRNFKSLIFSSWMQWDERTTRERRNSKQINYFYLVLFIFIFNLISIIIPIGNDIKIYDIDLALADFDLMIYPSEAVSIIGFPEGITSEGKLPIWKTGHIASDIDVDWGGKPAFLIDATTKGGMSGSPVIAERVSIYQTSEGNNIGNAVRFLGVYSGREIDVSGIEIGFVWKPRAITEILAVR